MGTVQLVVEVLVEEDATFTGTATVEGTSPQSTIVTDISTDGLNPDPSNNDIPDESVYSSLSVTYSPIPEFC